MPEYDSIECFEVQAECKYRGESYLVRDNGAICRSARAGQRKRPLDDKWTFGTPSKSDGYMAISGHKIHRIVATAFLGEQPSKNHVVDHIDTNRRNNRPTNLRWVTRLENILLNPITAKRIVFLYGSIEEFLADPGSPKNGDLSVDFEWMRTVSVREAEESKKRMLAWAASEKVSTGARLGDWIFGRMNKGEVAVISPWGETKIGEAALSSDDRAIYLLGEHGKDAIKPWSLSKITFEIGQFVHESKGTFFMRDGAEKEFTLAQGLPWEGGETFDDYC